MIEDLIAVIYEVLKPCDANLFKAMLASMESRSFGPDFQEVIVMAYTIGCVAGLSVCPIDRDRLESYVETYVNKMI